MLSNNQRKALCTLHRKKGREEAGLFLVEGPKGVAELLAARWPLEGLYATEAWTEPAGDLPLSRIDAGDMARISLLETPSCVLAVAHIHAWPDTDLTRGRWLALDGLQDPGNLGTILRLADWFGLDGLICSPDTVEATHPKVVQASMGSIFRVPVLERDLPELFRELPASRWVAGAFLEGANLFDHPLPASGILVLGNEGRGIRAATESVLTHRVTIPRFGGAESLNSAMAAAVFCAEWRRGSR